MKLLCSLNILIFCLATTFGQTENRQLIAYYPLMGSLSDSTGQNADLEVLNIDIRDSALYSTGANSFSDTANRIFGRFPELDLDDLYFSLDFRLDSADDNALRRSIIVGGSGWRWLSATYNQIDKELHFSYNNFSGQSGSYPYEYGRWYHLALSYHRPSQTGRMYIDGELVAEAIFDLETSFDRTLVLDCYCGTHAMAGFWRNLRIYGPEELSTPVYAQEVEGLKIYPNPVRDRLMISSDREFKQTEVVRIYQSGTSLYYETRPTGSNLQINTGSWPPGFYLINIDRHWKSFMKW